MRYAPSASSRRALSALMMLCLVGCPDAASPADAGSDAGASSATELVFDPVDGPIDFGAVPFPDDLYLDDAGRVELGALPSEDLAFPDYVETARGSLGELDGFGALGPIFFYARGDIDPSSLPAAPLDAIGADASVFLLDADSASPSAFDRIPVEVRWDAARRAIGVRPWEGHALRAGRLYAAVVTRRVRGADGLPLAADPDFASVRDAASRPEEPVLAEAWERYAPVLGGALGVPASEVVGLAVFRVQTVESELDDARDLVRAGEAPALRIERAIGGTDLDALLGVPSEDVPGLDVDGGVQHSHIGWVIDGRFAAPYLLSALPFTHGAFERDDSGALVAPRTDDVWFTLVVPAGEVSSLRAVIYQHGLGAERSSVFAIADALCAQGWAVLAIDIPFHGMRAEADPAVLDLAHAYGPSTGPDLYGDVTGAPVYIGYVGASDDRGALSPFHPFYVRDVLRQSVLDLFALVRQVEEGDWSVLEALGGPTGLDFAAEPLGFVGVSLGGIVGTTFVTAEPGIGAAVLNVTGGGLTQLVASSAGFRGTFLPLVAPRIGLDLAALDDAVLPARFSPELALYQVLLDAGDSTSFAPILAERPKDVLFQMAIDDETVPNSATEGLARSAAAVIAGASPRYSDLPTASLPLSANLEVGGRMVTRGLVTFAPATHGLLSRRSDTWTVAHPVEPPFPPRPAPEPVSNDVDGAVGQLVRFFESWRSGTAVIDAP
jgi:hypothetical protein